MNYAQAIDAVNVIAQALRTEEQSSILIKDELTKLREDVAYKSGRISALEETAEEFKREADNYKERYETEIRRNGELKATLKQLLAEQMALAGRAAEMLRTLEDKPGKLLGQTTQEEFEEELEIKSPSSQRSTLQKFVDKDIQDAARVPVGQTFVIDPPDSTLISRSDLKNWYRVTASKVPMDWKERPGVEFRKEHGGKQFLRFTAPAPKKEGREPLPFQGNGNSTAPDSNGSAAPSFNDDGAHIPGFLAQGPTKHDDLGGQS